MNKLILLLLLSVKHLIMTLTHAAVPSWQEKKKKKPLCVCMHDWQYKDFKLCYKRMT